MPLHTTKRAATEEARCPSKKRAAAPGTGAFSKEDRKSLSPEVTKYKQADDSEHDETKRFFTFMEARTRQPQKDSEEPQRDIMVQASKRGVYNDIEDFLYGWTDTYPKDDDLDFEPYPLSPIARHAQTPMVTETVQSSESKTDSAHPPVIVISDSESGGADTVASPVLEEETSSQQASTRSTPSTPQEAVASASTTPIGPQLFEMARCATELVVHATEQQLALAPATQRAVIRARLLADFNQYLHRAVGEFANRLL